MKKIFRHSLTILLFPLLITSCQKFLERDNPTATTDDKWWRIESDLRGYLEVIYVNDIPSGALVNNVTYQANARMQMSGVSDENVFRGNFGSWQNYATGILNSSDNYLADLYRQNYFDIRNASRILENYSKVYMEDLVIKERYAAEARALRAYAHLKLFLMFGNIPIVNRSVPFDEAGNLPRNTQEEVVNFITTQLDSAANILPATYTTTDNYRISKGACYAMQVQLYLSLKNYDKVIEYAKKVIALNVYDLHKATNATTNSYADLFGYNALINKEQILFRRAGNSTAFFRFAPKSAGGQATLSPTASMVNTYETLQGKTLQELGNDSLQIYWKTPLYKNNRDPRMAASIFFPGQTFVNRTFDPFNSSGADPLGVLQSTQTGFWVRKYVDATDVSRVQTGTLNFMVIRYAEILLSYVEALVESGDWTNPDVKLYLNAIRNRAGMPSYNAAVYNTQDKMREMYRRERKVELAFEGGRIFDIRRWRIGDQLLNGPVLGAINPTTNAPVTAETRTFNVGRDYLWPIPLTELNSNAAMTQNTGW